MGMLPEVLQNSRQYSLVYLPTYTLDKLLISVFYFSNHPKRLSCRVFKSGAIKPHQHLSEELGEGKERRAHDPLPSVPGCFKTPTGTITVGGGELRAPEAWACCKGGIVEQYSAGLLGLGLWLEALIMFSQAWAKANTDTINVNGLQNMDIKTLTILDNN